MFANGAYTVYRDYPTWGAYHAATDNGTEIAVNQNYPQLVMQAALDRPFWNDPSSGQGPGDVYIQAGNYEFTPDFSGLDVRSFTSLTLDVTARFTVPNGYGGHVFDCRAPTATVLCIPASMVVNCPRADRLVASGPGSFWMEQPHRTRKCSSTR
jgi:hypothetical protein